ncbi:MAG: hypothetical protein ACRDJ4_03250 [Actinomycetota bacterium]
MRAIAIHRIEDGRLAEHWSQVDSAAQMAQLGLIQLRGVGGAADESARGAAAAPTLPF